MEILWWKIGFTPRATFKLRSYQQYLWELSLIVASLGHHTQFTFQKHPHLGPQMTPSVEFQQHAGLWWVCWARSRWWFWTFSDVYDANQACYKRARLLSLDMLFCRCSAWCQCHHLDLNRKASYWALTGLLVTFVWEFQLELCRKCWSCAGLLLSFVWECQLELCRKCWSCAGLLLSFVWECTSKVYTGGLL